MIPEVMVATSCVASKMTPQGRGGATSTVVVPTNKKIFIWKLKLTGEERREEGNR